jgi:O-antigen ligase
LLLCIVLGGSAQDIWGNLALQVLGIALIGVAGLYPRNEGAGQVSIAIPSFMAAAGLIILLQLVPISPHMWTKLPGRSPIAASFAMMGYPLPAMPISEAPYLSTMTLFAVIPAVAVFVAVLRLAPRTRWLAASTVIGAILAIVLGALQVTGGPTSWAYPYKITNSGAVGFFANRNHLATLLLVAVPMTAALLATTKSDRRSSVGRYGAAAAVLLVLLGGVALNGSLAALTLVLPVLLASASLLPASAPWRRITLPVSVLVLFGGVSLIAINPIATSALDAGANVSVSSRENIWKTTSSAIRDSFPVGTGLGSFEQVFHRYENPTKVTTEYVNHAHNDYLELTLELGLPGAVLIALFLLWWTVLAARIWTTPWSSTPARAATVATAVVLAHSFVDFPLRTGAISSIFAACLAMMVQDLRPQSEPKEGEFRSTRHIKLG